MFDLAFTKTSTSTGRRDNEHTLFALNLQNYFERLTQSHFRIDEEIDVRYSKMTHSKKDNSKDYFFYYHL